MNAYRAVLESVNYSLEKAGFPPRDHETIKRTVGWGDKQLLKTFVGERNLAKVLKVYREHHARALARGTKLLPGALATLKFFKGKGLKLAVASNRPSRFSKIALKTLRIDRYFDCVVCADQVKRGKPHPGMFFKILKKLRLKAQEAMYVGDMTIDVMSGHRAGIKTVAVMTGTSRRREIKAHKPFKMIHSLKDLKTILVKTSNLVSCNDTDLDNGLK